jgi:hypothetical protein
MRTLTVRAGFAQIIELIRIAHLAALPLRGARG